MTGTRARATGTRARESGTPALNTCARERLTEPPARQTETVVRPRGSLSTQSGERVGAARSPCGQVRGEPCGDDEHERRADQRDGIEAPHAEEELREELCREQRRGHADGAANQH